MGIGNLEHPNEAFQLRRIQFVPAQRSDVTPAPTGVDIIVLNGVLPVRKVAVRYCFSSVQPESTGLQEQQDTNMKPGPSSASKNTKELFREQDVSLKWKTVQKTVHKCSAITRQLTA